MPKKAPPTARNLFSARLKQARELRGIPSQRALGVLMGLDKKLASARINRYEQETSGIDLDALGKLAETLDVPMAFLVAEDDLVAQAILALSKLPKAKRARAVEALLELAEVKGER